MIKKIEDVKDFVLSEEKSITNKKKRKDNKSKNKDTKKKTCAEQKSVVKNALRVYDERIDIINAFINENIYSENVEKDVYYEREKSELKCEKNIAERIKRQRYSEVIREEKDVNMELFQKYFNSLSPSQILKSFYNTNDKKEYFFQTQLKVHWVDLKDEIEKMSEDKPYKIVDILEKILYFNNQKQKVPGPKILTPRQLLYFLYHSKKT